MSTQPVWISESDVVELMSLPDAILALERALHLEAEGQAASMAKTMLQFGTSNLHALGGKLGDYVGTKTWAHTDAGTSPLLLLWNAHDGQLAAVIEAFALGSMRTGAISGLATDWMARADASVLAMVGTGKQALSQVAAVIAVRHIEQVRVFSPSPASRAAFMDRLGNEFRVSSVDCASVEVACEGADIVTLATRAKQPFLTSAMLLSGTHVNAVGAIGLDRAEFTQDLFARVHSVAADSLPGVKALSREFRTHFGEAPDASCWEAVKPLSGLIHGGARRAADADLTLFKAMGMGLSDLALGTVLLERARAAGTGRVFPAPRKAKPRFTRAAAAPV